MSYIIFSSPFNIQKCIKISSGCGFNHYVNHNTLFRDTEPVTCSSDILNAELTLRYFYFTDFKLHAGLGSVYNFIMASIEFSQLVLVIYILGSIVLQAAKLFGYRECQQAR